MQLHRAGWAAARGASAHAESPWSAVSADGVQALGSVWPDTVSADGVRTPTWHLSPHLHMGAPKLKFFGAL